MSSTHFILIKIKMCNKFYIRLQTKCIIIDADWSNYTRTEKGHFRNSLTRPPSQSFNELSLRTKFPFGSLSSLAPRCIHCYWCVPTRFLHVFRSRKMDAPPRLSVGLGFSYAPEKLSPVPFGSRSGFAMYVFETVRGRRIHPQRPRIV